MADKNKNTTGGNELEKEVAQKIQKENERKFADNIVFVGAKPLVTYIKSIIAQFNKRNSSEVVLKSRGKFISKAVDAAEVSRRILFKKGVKVKAIDISSESFEREGKQNNISTMDIVLGI